MTRWMCVGLLALAGCSGDTTDTTDTTDDPTDTMTSGDTGTEAPLELSDTWSGTCVSTKKSKSISLTLRLALDEEAGIVDGFGVLGVVKKADTGKTLGVTVSGTYDDVAQEAELDLEINEGILLQFVATLSEDTLAGIITLVPIDKAGEPKKIPAKKKKLLQRFDCTLGR